METSVPELDDDVIEATMDRWLRDEMPEKLVLLAPSVVLANQHNTCIGCRDHFNRVAAH